MSTIAVSIAQLYWGVGELVDVSVRPGKRIHPCMGVIVLAQHCARVPSRTAWQVAVQQAADVFISRI